MAELLVSVRSVAEARAALQGGAALIDIKEPANGALGRAATETLAAVVEFVAQRRPVSAALGELGEPWVELPVHGLAFVKWGLAGKGASCNWQTGLSRARERLALSHPETQAVAVAYADWKQAKAPPPAEVCTLACESHWKVLLLDTWNKDGNTLLDWLTPTEISVLCRHCREAGMRVALAGSLGMEEIGRLLTAAPDWFAVRGAVCRAGRREGEVDSLRVRELVDLLADAFRTATPAS